MVEGRKPSDRKNYYMFNRKKGGGGGKVKP